MEEISLCAIIQLFPAFSQMKFMQQEAEKPQYDEFLDWESDTNANIVIQNNSTIRTLNQHSDKPMQSEFVVFTNSPESAMKMFF